MLLKTAGSKKNIFYLLNKYSSVISKIETEMLLEYLFNCSRLDLYIRDFIVNETIEGLYDSLVSRRLNGEPAQYITGHAEFMGLDFIVTKDVLIPRPETELLADIVISSSRFGCFQQPHSNNTTNILRARPEGPSREVRILDLCTGSGNIAVSLAKLIPDAEITATDISAEALKIAEKNASRHNVSDRISFCRGNLFSALMFVKNTKFDIIICNPPYIKESDFPYLQIEVKAEPEIALNGRRDGLDFYRIIAKESHRYLEERGSILLEIGFGQKQAVEDIFSSNNRYYTYKTIKDFNQIDRVVFFKLVP